MDLTISLIGVLNECAGNESDLDFAHRFAFKFIILPLIMVKSVRRLINSKIASLNDAGGCWVVAWNGYS